MPANLETAGEGKGDGREERIDCDLAEKGRSRKMEVDFDQHLALYDRR